MKRTRFEVPCQPEELDAWRLAAGDVPVARWARRVLNEAAARGAVGELPVVEAVPVRETVREVEAVPVRSAFRSDFKGGKR